MRLHYDLNETYPSHFVYYNKICHLIHSYNVLKRYEMIWIFKYICQSYILAYFCPILNIKSMNFPNEQLCAYINGNKRVQAFLDGQAQVENVFRAGSFHESAYVKYCLFLTHIPLNHSDFLYAICVYGVRFHALEPYKV